MSVRQDPFDSAQHGSSLVCVLCHAGERCYEYITQGWCYTILCGPGTKMKLSVSDFGLLGFGAQSWHQRHKLRNMQAYRFMFRTRFS